jgi:hypothetical protein
MARVTLPLLGVSATGKLGQAIVYMPIPHARDGLTSVRRWLKPKNPESESQGDVRLKVKAAGYGVSFIQANSVLETQLKAATPAGNIWNAYFLKQCFGSNMANIDASLTAWDTAANSAKWTAVAASLGILDADISYASIDPITKGEILFLHAAAAYDLELAIATGEPQNMTSDDVQSFGAAYLAA